MDYACSWGTSIHESLEQWVKTGLTRFDKPMFKPYIEHAIKWLEEEGFHSFEPEVYICDKDNLYQGSVDLVCYDRN